MFIWKNFKFLFWRTVPILVLFVILGISLQIKPKDIFGVSVCINTLARDLTLTFLRVTLTSLAMWVLAIGAAKLMLVFKVINGFLYPLINFVRHISPLAWLPFAIIWFGLGEPPVIFVLAVTVFFPLVLMVYESLGGINSDYLDEAKVMGAGELQKFVYIELMLKKTDLLNQYRIVWGLSWAIAAAAEMLGVKNGMGYRLLDFRYLLQYKDMLHYIFVMGLTGIAVDLLLLAVIKKLK